eukprot:CAMPEP_0119495128 /NCGR_PEP_ID=MMETSP1344-20130328/18868_1 /TAXON_ID=236787 /ORGANISM="Florenciella parvula, Strain CCMP2471" /LENGTH=179 /DNA_ID=CAMNT_0007530691 /DNA_START=40 /DNA_END=579 /DNA_ORIENTATION=-
MRDAASERERSTGRSPPNEGDLPLPSVHPPWPRVCASPTCDNTHFASPPVAEPHALVDNSVADILKPLRQHVHVRFRGGAPQVLLAVVARVPQPLHGHAFERKSVEHLLLEGIKSVAGGHVHQRQTLPVARDGLGPIVALHVHHRQVAQGARLHLPVLHPRPHEPRHHKRRIEVLARLL